MKDTKLQMLTTHFEELKMSEDKSFDSFYGKLNEVVIGKFNLGEKTEDSKIVRNILHSLPESFCAKVTAIKGRKILMRLKFKNSSVLIKPISYLYHLKGRANLLLSRQSMRDWKLKTPRMRVRLKGMWRTWPGTSVSS